MIPYGRQDISDADVAAVAAVLKSDFLTQGPAVPAFENALAAYCGVKHAVAMNSATSALHIACLALDVGPGDLVWTTPNTFVASANCALYCGADVDFVDMDATTLNISLAALKLKLENAKARGQLPKVVIPVDFSGEPVDMKSVAALAKTYGFKIVEDASHAIGGRYDGKPVGASVYSDITVFSLHPVKIITSGEGGVALTNNDDLGKKLARLRSHGITRDVADMQSEPEGPWYYEMLDLGYNYRMTDIHAALGLSQLSRLDEFVMKRQQLANRYDEVLKDLPLILPERAATEVSALHLYVVQIDPTRSNASRKDVFVRLRELGIGVNVHYMPVHLQPFYRARGFKRGDFPASETYYDRAISIPLYATLTEAQQDTVVAAFKQALA
jgi:UDP-4-amino-4,6-dideoxy-N-acetyl-beta-L-altrosamine transaminase